ncbi:M20 family metallo-hydrolase [Psychromonas sp. PT13]|uniref:M20 family metallo-hydrolase n=1 Tax=Psychromonas sp. PT13 TaxID=3439547 RepID=UPI003EBAC580
MTEVTLSINAARLQSRLLQLGEVGALVGGGVSRLALSDDDKLGRDLVVSWMKGLDLDIAIDPIGNVVATLKGSQDLPCIMMGSHIDTVSTGGLYDGNLGVLAGLEVIETLIESNLTPVHPVSVGFFTNEEGSRFAPDMLGSAVYAQTLDLQTALKIKAIDGPTLEDELQRIGYQGTAQFPDISKQVGAYFELHVEQGPVLDEQNIEIGVVEGVQGISWHEYTVTGISNHAGTTPMQYRNDAGLVAAKINVFINELADSMAPDQHATVGALEIKPNLINVIPNFAKFTVDLRNRSEIELQKAESALSDYIDKLIKKHGVEISKRKLARFEPVNFNPSLINGIEAVAKANKLSTTRMFSGAGHDAQMFAPHCPTTMIFVPSYKGISHNIDEYTSPEQVANGANVLLQTVSELAYQKRSLPHV